LRADEKLCYAIFIPFQYFFPLHFIKEFFISANSFLSIESSRLYSLRSANTHFFSFWFKQISQFFLLQSFFKHLWISLFLWLYRDMIKSHQNFLCLHQNWNRWERKLRRKVWRLCMLFFCLDVISFWTSFWILMENLTFNFKYNCAWFSIFFKIINQWVEVAR
jgi:hypothetical protein